MIELALAFVFVCCWLKECIESKDELCVLVLYHILPLLKLTVYLTQVVKKQGPSLENPSCFCRLICLVAQQYFVEEKHN